MHEQALRKSNMDKSVQTEIEAAVFRRLITHLDEHKDVQNIELMILADFCRNCLANGTAKPPQNAAKRWIMMKPDA